MLNKRFRLHEFDLEEYLDLEIDVKNKKVNFTYWDGETGEIYDSFNLYSQICTYLWAHNLPDASTFSDSKMFSKLLWGFHNYIFIDVNHIVESFMRKCYMDEYRKIN